MKKRRRSVATVRRRFLLYDRKSRNRRTTNLRRKAPNECGRRDANAVMAWDEAG